MREPLIFRKAPNSEELIKCAQQYAKINPLFFETFLALVHTSNELLNNAVDYFGHYGTTPGRFGIMMQLKLHGEKQALNPSTIAERCGVTRATITGLLDRLDRDGFIARKSDPNDRRAQIVRLSKKGNKFLDDFLPGHFQRIQGIMRGISDKEKKQLHAILTKIMINLDEFRETVHSESNMKETS